MTQSVDRETRMAQAILIARKHPEVDCVIEAYRHLHEKELQNVSAPDVSNPPHE